MVTHGGAIPGLPQTIGRGAFLIVLHTGRGLLPQLLITRMVKVALVLKPHATVICYAPW